MKKIIAFLFLIAGLAYGQPTPVSPVAASQAEVDAGLVKNKYVSPFTLNNWSGGGGGSGTVTSVSFTGGLISVGTPTTTPAFTIAGTSGGIPYFSSASTWASSAALTDNVVLLGGGAGNAPTGSLITDNGTTLTYTGTGGISLSGGSTAGTLELAQGTAPSAGTTSIKFYAPAAVTSYIRTFPGAAGTGFYLGTNSAGVVTDTQVTPGTGVATAMTVATNATGGFVTAGGAPRILTITSSGTPAINTDAYDCVTITAQAAAITSMTSSRTGTINNFQQLEIRIKDDGTARAITWGADFASGMATLPTTTILGKTLTVYLEGDTVTGDFMCQATGSYP